jgi:tetratricopeptide (TPR) repeat protein
LNAFTLVVSRLVILLLVLSLVLVAGRFLYDRMRPRSPRLAALVFASLVVLGFLAAALPVAAGAARAVAENAYRRGRWERAARWYYVDWRLGGGKDLVALPNWGTALMQLHRWKAAEQVLRSAVEERPGGVVAIPQHVLLVGICRYYLGADAAADRDLRSIRAAVPTPVVPYYLGRIAERRGDPAAAAANYAESLRQQPTFFPAAYQQARLLSISGDSAGAREVAEELRRRSPGDPDAAGLRAELDAGAPPPREFLVVPR